MSGRPASRGARVPSTPKSARGSTPQRRGIAIVHDDARKVQVALPRSLPELQKAVATHFGEKKGHLRLHHHGIHPVTVAAHVGGIQHGDLVVVSWDEEGSERAKTPSQTTTQRADFVQHPLPANVSSKAVAKPFAATGPTGNSRYQQDYVPHPLMQPDLRNDNRRVMAWDPSKEPTGQTTYGEAFQKFDTERVRGARPSGSHEPVAFTATSSHAQEFLRHANAEPAKSHAPKMRARTKPQPFTSATTYQADYQDFPMDAPPPTASRPATETLPFNESSEYQLMYMNHPPQTRPHIHLAPERRPRSTEPTSQATLKS